MRAMLCRLLGLAVVVLAAGPASAAPAGFRRPIACDGWPYREITTTSAGEWGYVRYAVPCGYYGHVGINEDVYTGPYPPPVVRVGAYPHRHNHGRRRPAN